MITVTPYDPEWPQQFEALRSLLAGTLAGAPVLAIEHVGSTAVPGLAAKPVLDIDIVVPADGVAAASAALVRTGFVARGDLGVPQRFAFRAPPALVPNHTYVVVDGCAALRNHLAVRDLLRADPVLREAYGTLKLGLAATAPDIDSYVAQKSPFLLSILARAGFGRAELAAIEAINAPR